MLKTISRAALVAAAIAFSPLPSFAADIAGAGSTFAFPIYTKWADSFKKETGDAVNYQGIGSGAGIKQLQSKTIVFAGTDIPMKVEDLKKNGFVQWPMVMGGIAAVVNIDGVKPGQLVLDGPTLANIYMGNVKKWDDAAIKKLNPSLTLPSADIQVVRRADGSGTTFNFTDYLSKVSQDWADKVGSDASVEWPVGVGAKGNDGVAGTVGQTKNSIGYVETAYIKQNNMTYVDMINKAGKHVSPTVDALQAAAANADWAHAPGYYQILTDQPGDASWPITAATFVVVYADPSDKAASGEVVKFFDWAYKNGNAAASDLNYIPMPAGVTDMVRKTWASDIKNK
ncbi:phosphate ABC transporter substrate-binding protein PstS [Methylovirgula sp. 4M-Z18]